MSRRSRKTQPFGPLAARVLGRADTHSKRKGAAAVGAWAVVAGDAIASHTRGFALRDDGELVVFVDGSAWANQLSLMSEELMTRLNEHLGEQSVRTLRFTVSRRAREGFAAPEQDTEAGLADADWPEPVGLDEIEMAQASRVASIVKDEALREAALRAMRRDLELKKGLRLNRSGEQRKHAPGTGREEGL